MSVASASSEQPVIDPYSLDVMRRAVADVGSQTPMRARGAAGAGIEIEATHRYVCFSPATRAQFDALYDQRDFTCYNFRIDEPSDTEGEPFRMAEPSDTPDRVYAVLPVALSLPDTIAWETLKEFYDPASSARGQADPDWANRVVAQARLLADDGRHPGEIIAWAPAGKITVWDDIANGYIPIEGATVSIVSSSDILHPMVVTTKKDGTFRATSLVNNFVTYVLTWDTDDWTMKSGALASADLRKTALEQEWNVAIGQNDLVLGPATVFRAAYRYWHKMPALGLKAPAMGRKIRFLCHNSVNFNYTWNGKEFSASGVFHPTITNDAEPDIELGGKITPSILIGVAAHEISHAAHYTHSSIFNKTTALIKESWARFIEYIVTEQEYKDLNLYGKLHTLEYVAVPSLGNITFMHQIPIPDDYNRQIWMLNITYENNRLYTPLFIDLYDDFNQYEWYQKKGTRLPSQLALTPDDPIYGFSIEEIQAIAWGSRNKNEAIGYIRSFALKHNFTQNQIDRYWQVYAKIGDESYDRYK